VTDAAGSRIVIDVHNHVLTPEAQEIAARWYEPLLEPYDLFAGAASARHNQAIFGDLVQPMTDPDRRIADMDRMGVDVQVLSIFVSQYYYWLDAVTGLELARLQNQHLAELVGTHPERFTGAATVPMQDVRLACEELRRAHAELGFRAVQISTNVNGTDLDHPSFDDFFATAAELGTLVILHPNGFTDGRRLTDFYLINVIGNPLDSTIAAARMIFSGLLDHHPELAVCIVHGGGYTPFYWPRMDHAYRVRPECRERLRRTPSDYLRSNFYFDTVVFEPELVRRLADDFGVDRVLLGTDYPFDMGETSPVELVARVPGLSEPEAAAILGGTAARLLDLPRRSG
jgi:aminocarboxymuconate-semialdehyde decarboxylase